MTKRYWILIGICISLWIVIFPIVVLGESATYITYTGEDLFPMTLQGDRVIFKASGTDVRFVALRDSINQCYMWAVKPASSSSTMSYKRGSNSWQTVTYWPVTTEYNGISYKLVSYGTSSGILPIWNGVFQPCFQDGFNNSAKALYYTYGAGVVDPIDPTNWGLLRDVEFQTRIAGQGLASKRNIDYLSWQNVNDANGNDISECDVEVQAVLGRFYANNEADLLEKTLNDFDIGTYNAVNLGTVPASQGTYSASWERIIDLAGWNFDSIYSHLEDNIFLKNGWYYQIRLISPDGYIGSWQTLYTPLAQSASASETVINNNSYSMDIYQVYEQLTQINNQTSITVTFDNTTYTIQNPNDGTEPSEPLDYFDILKQLLNGIIQIVGSIQELPQRLGEKAQELITPQLSEGESLSDQFHQRYEEYMSSEQTTIYDFLQGVEDLQPYIEDLAPGDEGVHTCIIRWDNVTMNLSMFNAGTVTFIQGGEYNLTLAFLNLLHAFNMDYEDYEFYTSAIIYLWLCVFVWRHFKHFLEKE